MCTNLSKENLNLLCSAIQENSENCLVTLGEGNEIGDGHTSNIVFVCVQTKNGAKKYDLLLKQRFKITNEITERAINLAFKNEILAYKEIYPALERFQEEENVNKFNSIAKCYATSSEVDNEKIVLENLKLQGFRLHKKSIPLNDSELRIVFETYADFHGTSLAFKLKQAGRFDKLVDRLTDLFEFLSANIVHKVADLGLNIEEKDVERIQKFLDYGMRKAVQIETSNSQTVLIHGDCWSNNVMFKYDDENKPISMRIVDLQMSKKGNPVMDLVYFFYTSLLEEKLLDVEYYLKLYHDRLVTRLQEFGLDGEAVYPFQQLKLDWVEFAGLGFSLSLFLTRLKFSDEYTTDDPSDVMENDSVVKFDVDKYKSHISHQLQHLSQTNMLKDLL